jgi:TetR/AcrR family transcriptional repressor of nem operon
MPRQKEFEREDVLEKALGVFWCNGYNATSFQDLTEGMCINRQSIYDTYGDKHALFIEALKHYSKKNTITTEAHFAQNKPVKDLFTSYFQKAVDNIVTDPQHKGCFITNSTLEMIPHDEEVSKIAAGNMADLKKIFQTAITRGIKTGEIPRGRNAGVLALFLINTIHGFNAMGKTTTDKKKLQRIAAVAVNALFE